MTNPDSTFPADEPPADADAPRDDDAVEAVPPSMPTATPLEAAEARAAELEDRLRRTEAEFVNETKRIRKNADAQGRFAIERVVTDLLPAFDALHSAHDNTQEADAAHREGLALIERQLMDALNRHGIERIEAVGQPFDPGFHEAMLVVPDATQPDQTVSQEMRAGYTLNGRVVRPAQVMVTKHPHQPKAVPAAPDDQQGDDESTPA